MRKSLTVIQKSLIEAINNKDIDVIKAFLIDGNPNVQLGDHGSLLYYTIQNELYELTKLLILAGADVDLLSSSTGSCPLVCAIDTENIEFIQLLVESGADVNLICKEQGVTPLGSALFYGDFETIAWLIDKGADVNLVDRNFWHPLEFCKYTIEILDNKEKYNKVKKLRYLLIQHGADINYKNDGVSPFMEAINKGHFEVAQEYLDENADIHIIDKDGWTPVNRILSVICNNDLPAKESYTGLDGPFSHFNVQESISNNRDELLSRQQLDWNMYISDSEEYFEDRRPHGVKLVKRLITMGADVRTPNNHGWTPLMYASGDSLFSEVLSNLVTVKT